MNAMFAILAPQALDQRGFATALASAMGRRARLRLPAAPLSRTLGEMSDLLLRGQSVTPRAALAAGYMFHYATIAIALA